MFLIPIFTVDSFGLSCAPVNMTKSVEETQIIFSGIANSSEKSNENSFNVITLFSITENFKGIDEESVEVYSDETWGPYFQEGFEYLVFADRFDDKIQAQLCSPTDTVGNSEIKLVRQLSENFTLPFPQIQITINPNEVKYGESLLFQYSLPSYDKPDDLHYTFSVKNPQGIEIDATLWFAREASEYTFETFHPAYNITESGRYILDFEKTLDWERTGEIVQTVYFEITTNPPPLTQHQRGVTSDSIRCNGDLELIIKNDNSPACVKGESVSRLIERGWGKIQ